MARKQTAEGGKKGEIIEAALQLFLENGYDGTSVRMIQKKVGSEVGLFYYYFKNKDELFDYVLDRFFARYEADFARIVSHGRRNPCRVMQDFFEYMETQTAKFRARYAGKMHRTMRWAIREHTLEIIEPYLEQIVEIQSAYYGVPPALEPAVAAMYLTHGVGSYILHEDRDKYLERRAEVKRGTSLVMGMPAQEQELRTPYPASADDIPGWIALTQKTKESVPGFDETEHRERLKNAIAWGEAWVYRVGDKIAGALLYSKERRELDFLAVHPDDRRKGLARRLVETMAAQFPVGAELSVTAFRENDPEGKQACAFYKALGFTEGGETTVFGRPCRRLVLTVSQNTAGSGRK